MYIGKTKVRAVFASALAVAILLPLSARADNTFGIQLAGGTANHHGDNTQKIDLGLVWDPHLHWWAIGGWNFAILGEAHAAYWNTGGNVDRHIGEFGLSPVLRFEKSSGAIRPYIEAGAGIRILTHARISDTYTLSSGFQFADMIGVGLKFGARQQYQLGYRFQHLSNASIKRPNPGVDFQQIYLQYNF